MIPALLAGIEALQRKEAFELPEKSSKALCFVQQI
jgi:hypothetical protein